MTDAPNADAATAKEKGLGLSRDHALSVSAATPEVALQSPKIELGTTWERIKPTVQGRGSGRIWLSHWNRQQPHLVVAYGLRANGEVNKKSSHSIHPRYLISVYRPSPVTAPLEGVR